MRCLAPLAVPFSLVCACGQTSSVGLDGALDASIDATPADASEPDAFDACPGQATFQVEVVDWVTGDSLEGVNVQSGPSQASSAPNGRVVLCVPRTGDLMIALTHPDYLDRLHTTTGPIVSELASTTGVAVFRLLTAEDADALYAGTGAVGTRSSEDSTLIAMVRDRLQGSPAAGATVSLSATHDGAYTPAEPAGLSPGAVTLADGRVLFLNASTAGSPAIGATGLGTCLQPDSIALTAGAISSTTLACLPE